MAEPTISDVFGANATQNATSITIQKNDLVSLGLTPSAGNTAESLLVAIILASARNLTEALREADPTNRNVTIYSGGTDLTSLGGINYRRDAFSVLLYKLNPLTAVDPDDY